jgi:hypothetical protein
VSPWFFIKVFCLDILQSSRLANSTCGSNSKTSGRKRRRAGVLGRSKSFYPRNFKLALPCGDFPNAQIYAKKFLGVVGALAQFKIYGMRNRVANFKCA